MDERRRRFVREWGSDGTHFKRTVPNERAWCRERSRWCMLAEGGIEALGQVPMSERPLRVFLERYVEYCLGRAREADLVEGGAWSQGQPNLF